MARAKKEAALTPEERLQAALVPDWEWPYKLPKNWCWTTVGTICDGFQYGYTEKATFEKIGPHFIRITDIGDGIINDSGAPYCKIDSDSFIKYKINKNDILIARMGSVGENGLATHNIDGVFASYLIRIVPRSSAKYVCNFLQTNLYWGQISEKAQGTTRLNVNANVLKDLIIPLPPLAEQQRIVDRIESLFAKLDEAKEKAQAVVDSFETRKAAILHKAFAGELTKKWRKSANTRWVYKKIKDCCKLGSGGTPSRKVPDFYKGDIPWIKTGEIEWNDIYDTEEKITQSAIDNSSARCYKPGVVLVAMYGMGVTRGKASILRVQAATNQAVCVLEPQSALLYNRYLLYYFMRNYWDIREKAVGGNQLNLSLTIIKELNIEIPPIDEQMEIVQILDDLFAKEQKAKESAEAVLDQIDLMKKSILARAFRGELGTNDPSEESAVELLKRVL